MANFNRCRTTDYILSAYKYRTLFLQYVYIDLVKKTIKESNIKGYEKYHTFTVYIYVANVVFMAKHLTNKRRKKYTEVDCTGFTQFTQETKTLHRKLM